MDANTELTAQRETSDQWTKLSKKYLEPDTFREPKKSPQANIMDQYAGVLYHFPFNIRGFGGLSEGSVELSKDTVSETDSFKTIADGLEASDYIVKSENTPISDFFDAVEACRRAGVPMFLCEKQYFTIEKKRKELAPLEDDWASTSHTVSREPRQEDVDALALDDNPDVITTTPSVPETVDEFDDEFDAGELASNLEINKSGIELDFDIYQRSPDRQITDIGYWQLIQQVAMIFSKTLVIEQNMSGMTNENFLTTYAVILRKPEVVFGRNKKHGDCYKDSFHLRFPGIKVSKAYKCFLIDKIVKDRVLEACLHEVSSLINTHADVLDKQSASFPSMLLGSMKKNGIKPHYFYKLAHVQVLINAPHPTCRLDFVNDFDPIIDDQSTIKVKHPTKKGNHKITVTAEPKFKYNLVHELSLLYEAPRGLIKKREFEPIPELAAELRTLSEKHASYGEFDEKQIITNMEIAAVDNAVDALCHRNHEASYYKELLRILSPERTTDYGAWLKVIRALAWESPEFKPLAVWFSLRCPDSWANKGPEHLQQNWEWALSHNPDSENIDHVSIKVLQSWARRDNPEEYKRIQQYNSMSKLHNLAIREQGDLTETSVSDLLHSMFGSKFISDENMRSASRGPDIKWYEFVYPDDDNGRIKGYVYKWRLEKGDPVNLDKYISDEDKLPKFIDRYRDYIKEKIDKLAADVDEAERSGNPSETKMKELTGKITYYENISDNMYKTRRRLRTQAFITNIIKRCKVSFRDRGFEEVLDTNEDVLGVSNGVLQLMPVTELIQRYHEIPISRFTRVDYEPYDPNNPIIKETEEALKRLFVTPDGKFDEESYNFNMMYLASSLDGRKKQALFMIWVGDGSAGKSSLLELHINTLRSVIKNGYGNKLNTTFFTSPRPGGGPDTEKMTTKHARFNYCSETEFGDSLYMARIKEFTGGENIAGNDKNEKQDIFEPNGIFIFCSNNEPNIRGSDYGTWRRILETRFLRKFRPKGDVDATDPLAAEADPKWNKMAPKNPEYQKAYLSILVKFYEMLRDKYGSDITQVPHKRIKEMTRAYRDDQDIYSKFITEQTEYIGKKFPGTNKDVKRIPLEEVAEKFRKWYSAKINSNHPQSAEILKSLKQTSINKYVRTYAHRDYVEEHYIMALNEAFSLEETVAKIKAEEGISAPDTDDVSETEGAPPPEPIADEGNDNFDLPDDFSDEFDEPVPEFALKPETEPDEFDEPVPEPDLKSEEKIEEYDEFDDEFL
jgi:hypothetical protein